MRSIHSALTQLAIFALVATASTGLGQTTDQVSVQSLQDGMARSLRTIQNQTGLATTENGPRIDQIVVRSGHVEIEKTSYPQPTNGEKMVVIPLPKTAEGNYDVDAFQVALKFTLKRPVSSCNTVTLQGEVEAGFVLGQPTTSFYRMIIKAGKQSSTYRACKNHESEIRDVEIMTELEALRKFRENLVIYVPRNVTVSARVFQQAMIIPGVEP